ncbi:thiamine-monophosphate kinase [Diplodia corticola]|uniref:Thiamine-monophosphate kinase n=1 Tax=Diplodia corticola TaxID=236234 RepID=A0A1J9RFD5_9PEZI|nr:thiamine-monophosphate kinase [Diplodia corticola]OJD31275.1 thiamine-monophosphate kinase [Diplodia corticola]
MSSSSHHTTNPAGNTLPGPNAYYCCKCLYGPMLYELHPACIECGAPACGYCSPISIGLNHPGHALQDQLGQPDPRDPYGSSMLGFSNTSASLMDRFFQDRPNGTERL